MKNIFLILFILLSISLYSQSTLGGYIYLDSNGTIELLTTARNYKTVTANFSHSIVAAHGKPTAVTLGTHNGFSLPVYSSDNEELFACKSLPLRFRYY